MCAGYDEAGMRKPAVALTVYTIQIARRREAQTPPAVRASLTDFSNEVMLFAPFDPAVTVSSPSEEFEGWTTITAAPSPTCCATPVAAARFRPEDEKDHIASRRWGRGTRAAAGAGVRLRLWLLVADWRLDAEPPSADGGLKPGGLVS